MDVWGALQADGVRLSPHLFSSLFAGELEGSKEQICVCGWPVRPGPAAVPQRVGWPPWVGRHAADGRQLLVRAACSLNPCSIACLSYPLPQTALCSVHSGARLPSAGRCGNAGGRGDARGVEGAGAAAQPPRFGGPVRPAGQLGKRLGCGTAGQAFLFSHACGKVGHGMAWHGMAWRCTVCHGMAWHGMAWHDLCVVRNGMAKRGRTCASCTLCAHVRHAMSHRFMLACAMPCHDGPCRIAPCPAPLSPALPSPYSHLSAGCLLSCSSSATHAPAPAVTCWLPTMRCSTFWAPPASCSAPSECTR